jgi:hypothetical protein
MTSYFVLTAPMHLHDIARANIEIRNVKKPHVSGFIPKIGM